MIHIQRSVSLPSLKLADTTGIYFVNLREVYTCTIVLTFSFTGESDVEQTMLSSKVTRLNISELYQHLNAESILQLMVDRRLILPAKKEDAVVYSHKYAQNSVAIEALFSTPTNPAKFLLSLCDVLEATGNSQQLTLATKLRSGMFKRFLDAHIYCLFSISRSRKTYVTEEDTCTETLSCPIISCNIRFL